MLAFVSKRLPLVRAVPSFLAPVGLRIARSLRIPAIRHQLAKLLLLPVRQRLRCASHGFTFTRLASKVRRALLPAPALAFPSALPLASGPLPSALCPLLSRLSGRAEHASSHLAQTSPRHRQPLYVSSTHRPPGLGFFGVISPA